MLTWIFWCHLMAFLIPITLDLVYGTLHNKPTDCPCSDAALCQPIQDIHHEEIFIFSVTNNPSTWLKYNWTKITTVAMFGYLNTDLMCLAHKHGARAVIVATFPTAKLTNAKDRTAWVEMNLDLVTKNKLDGINIDFEDAIPKDKTDLKNAYTALVAETFIKFKRANKTYQVTVDIAWSPDCIDQRCYDYISLADTTDFVFVMSYDEQSQIRGPCVAAANSGYAKTLTGVKAYLSLGIPADKLVLGIPWYGYKYPCLSLSKDNVCAIKPVPFRGVNCSDAAGTEINYDVLLLMLKNSTTGRIWDSNTLSPYFNYIEKGTVNQIWYDDPQSLGKKYTIARDLKLRGVGMWNADALDYIHDTPGVIKQRDDMWQALPDYSKVPYFNVDYL